VDLRGIENVVLRIEIFNATGLFTYRWGRRIPFNMVRHGKIACEHFSHHRA
jgi:hypothetical protein